MRDLQDGPTMLTTDENGRKVETVPKISNGVGSEYVDSIWLARTFTKQLRGVGTFVGGIAWRWNNLPEDDVKNL